MSTLQSKTVLLFCPRFFTYETEIKNALENKGARVYWFDERPSNSFSTKVLIRINRDFLFRKIDQYYDAILLQLKNQSIKPDYVLFVNPESIGIRHLKALRELVPEAVFILYMWDSFKNKKKSKDVLPLFDTAFTFDPEDAEKYNLRLRPLFFSEKYAASPANDWRYDFLFIGTAHSDRYHLVKKIINGLPPEARGRFYFYLNSRKLFWLQKILRKDFRKIRLKDISFTSLSQQETANLIHQSKVIIDINHPQQVGLTMRTLETLGAQRKLVTTNERVTEYDFYDEQNILVIDRGHPVIPADFLHSHINPADKGVLYRYSISGWLDELFELK